jgi:uncharacterized protein RhaS with RHS repeats
MNLSDLTYKAGSGSLIRALEYEYDTVGMSTNRTITAGTTAVSSYEYDLLDRLTVETRTAGFQPALSMSYAYDLAGNRLTKTNNSTAVVIYSLTTDNQLASWSASIGLRKMVHVLIGAPFS